MMCFKLADVVYHQAIALRRGRLPSDAPPSICSFCNSLIMDFKLQCNTVSRNLQIVDEISLTKCARIAIVYRVQAKYREVEIKFESSNSSASH